MCRNLLSCVLVCFFALCGSAFGAEIPVLSITPMEFKNLFNRYAPEVGLSQLPLKPTKKKSTDKNTIHEYTINDYCVVVLTMPPGKTDSLQNVVLISTHDGTSKSAQQMVLNCMAFLAALTEGEDEEKRADVFQNLGLAQGEIADGTIRRTVLGTTRFGSNLNPQIGLMLTAHPDSYLPSKR